MYTHYGVMCVVQLVVNWLLTGSEGVSQVLCDRRRGRGVGHGEGRDPAISGPQHQEEEGRE